MGRPYCVGLTGGAGSGKSEVAAIFAGLGAGIVDTDAIAHDLTAPGGAAMESIRAEFGDAFLRGDGGLDRARMRAAVFADDAARGRLEAILHPLIRERVGDSLIHASAAYVIVVVPLLVETGAYREWLDRVLVVDCEPALQIGRIMNRPGIDAAMAERILAAQASRERRLAVADDVIANNGARSDLKPRVAALHQRYLMAAQGRMRRQALQ